MKGVLTAYSKSMEYSFTVSSIDFDRGLIAEKRGRSVDNSPLYRWHLFCETELKNTVTNTTLHGEID